MRVLAFGGGTDSTGILCHWAESGKVITEPIDIILFADTGAERPNVYEHIERLNGGWLRDRGLPQVIVVRNDGMYGTLENNCLVKAMLPSIAYGFKSCSDKYKIRPQEKYMKKHPEVRRLWKAGEKIEKLIGYEFKEERRWAKAKVEDDHYTYRFPLVELEWNRADCVEAIARAGLPTVGKSACFFCPSSTKPEISRLEQEHPELFARALALEDNARPNFQTVKGLGRRFSWREYTTTKEESEVMPCLICQDGGGEDDDAEVPVWLRAREKSTND